MSKVSTFKKNQLESNGLDNNFSRSLPEQLSANAGNLEDAKVEINANTDTVIEDTTITIQGDIADVSTDVSNSTTAINGNTDTKTSAVTTNVNSNTGTVATSVINPNTNTEVAKLKPTPTGGYSDITSGASYQTVVSYSGQGFLNYANFYHKSSGSANVGFRITIDGTIYGASTANTTAVTYGIFYPFNSIDNDTTTTLYVVGAIAYDSNISDIPFKTSLLVEAYSQGDQTRRCRYMYTKYV